MMSFKTSHPLKTEAVAVFGGLAAAAAGVSTWLTEELEPWAQGVIAGGVAFVVALLARFVVWSQRSVDELQGNHLDDEEIIARTAAEFEKLNVDRTHLDLVPGETIHITED
jgi:membrane protein implicated in regulation of membrane protease activity